MAKTARKGKAFDPSKPLENARHERFCHGLAIGKTIDLAYQEAGFLPNRSNASRANSKDSVKARVSFLMGKAAKRAEVTAETIALQLDEDREFAKTQGHSSAAVSATMGKAKVLGLLPERVQLTGKDGGPIETMDLSKVSDADLAKISAILTKASDAPGDQG